MIDREVDVPGRMALDCSCRLRWRSFATLAGFNPMNQLREKQDGGQNHFLLNKTDLNITFEAF